MTYDQTYSEKLFQNIRDRLLSHEKTEHKGKYIRNISCPSCNKNEAWTYHDKPLAIVCPRANECGSTTPIKELYPDCFLNLQERFPSSKKDPTATARAYLLSRGFQTSEIKFKQGKAYREEKSYPTVLFEIDSETTCERLIDYEEKKNKNHIKGPYQGKFWKQKKLNYQEKIWVVEGIIDALSLNKCGLQAIAVLSSSHLPENCYKGLNLSKAKIVLAFDDDKAGKKALKKHAAFLQKQKKEGKEVKFEIAIPPSNKDWNKLLQEGALNEENLSETLDNTFWKGRLFQAVSPKKHFEILCEKYGNASKIFEFQHNTFRGTVKEKDNESAFSTHLLLDCILKILYSIEDDSIKYNSKRKYRIKIESKKENEIVEFTSEELSNLNLFKAKLVNHSHIFFGNGDALNHLTKHLFETGGPKIRQTKALGYDQKSDCFVFSKHLYNKEGKRFVANKEGYFENQKVAPFNEKTTEQISEINIEEFFDTLFQAHSYRGLLALGFWTASLFSHSIFEKLGFFPFLSLYGDPHCGKSDLTRLLNRCFFMDWEGINMTKANTQKGELRRIAQKCSLPTPMLEGRKDKTRFDYDSILGAYNRNAIQVRAKNTNGNETHELPFESTLVFVQNREQFESKAAKERVVSILFQESELDENTYSAWQKLSEYSPEQLACVGHLILKERKYFQRNFIEEIKNSSNILREIQGIKIDRIAKNHTIPYAGIKLICKVFNIKTSDAELLSYITKIARSKIETARTTNLLAEHFFESLLSLKYKNKDSTHEVGYIEKNNKLIVHLPTALQEMKNQSLGTWNKKELTEALNEVAVEKKPLRFGGQKKDCWSFPREKVKK